MLYYQMVLIFTGEFLNKFQMELFFQWTSGRWRSCRTPVPNFGMFVVPFWCWATSLWFNISSHHSLVFIARKKTSLWALTLLIHLQLKRHQALPRPGSKMPRDWHWVSNQLTRMRHVFSLVLLTIHSDHFGKPSSILFTLGFHSFLGASLTKGSGTYLSSRNGTWMNLETPTWWTSTQDVNEPRTFGLTPQTGLLPFGR